MSNFLGKTEFVFLSGKGKWFKLFRPSDFDDYRLELYPDKESLDIIKGLKEAGMKNVLKKDEDGYFMTFKCNVKKEIKGRMVTFQPPQVLDKDGNQISNTTLIGNGSDVTIKLEVYEHRTPSGGKAKACRLVAVAIENLVPFIGERDSDEGQKEAVEGLAAKTRKFF